MPSRLSLPGAMISDASAPPLAKCEVVSLHDQRRSSSPNMLPGYATHQSGFELEFGRWRYERAQGVLHFDRDAKGPHIRHRRVESCASNGCQRSEERRVGKEWRVRWWAAQSKQKSN